MRPGSHREARLRGRDWLVLSLRGEEVPLGLCFFIPLEGGVPSAEDREDRRALLDDGRGLETRTERELEELLDAAVPLTDTERRFCTGEGAPWLAQNTGPVWARDAVASGLTGVLLTCLRTGRRVSTSGGHVGGLSVEELRALLDEAAGERT